MKVLNFGSLNLDYVYAVDHMVMAGETLASKEMNTFCGGKGLNQSVALARAGVPVYHAGL
ncbi:MAG TPA: ribokinase, partial [Lachnospiraceae bacterium]|nr:ribokinase [Lachnospiraceae bacterium]